MGNKLGSLNMNDFTDVEEIISLDSGRGTLVNAKVEVQQQAGPFLVEIHKIMYGK